MHSVVLSASGFAFEQTETFGPHFSNSCLGGFVAYVYFPSGMSLPRIPSHQVSDFQQVKATLLLAGTTRL